MPWYKKYKSSAIFLVALVIFLIVMVIVFIPRGEPAPEPTPTPTPKPTSAITPEPTIPPTPRPDKYTEITFLTAGDIMYHRPQIRVAATNSSWSEGDYTPNMKYVKSIVEAADFATANLETVYGGPEIGYTQAQFPLFNAPDCTADSIAWAGFDLLFTANNHCYDRGHNGIIRTLDVLDAKGLDHIGTRKSTEERTYKVVDVKGTKLGLMDFTYESGTDSETVRINGNSINPNDVTLIDSFDENNPQSLYDRVQTRMQEMKGEGADLIIVYLHWGVEYDLNPSTQQNEIAQKLCDMGVDAIIASHPHVIQPVKVITSTDGTRTMPCIFSMGNYISNQTRDRVAQEAHGNARHCENGIMPIFTIRKYSNGETYITNIQYYSTWVKIGNQYYIIPVEPALSDPGAYGLDNAGEINVTKQMVDNIVKEGIDEFNALWNDPYPFSEKVDAA